MSTSYKPLVERFDIPRPTLIEWQKKANEDSKNWRVRHLDYLRNQLWIEQETYKEIRFLGPRAEDLFVLSVYFFFYNLDTLPTKEALRNGLREFALETRSGVEYRHEFAQRIWSLKTDDESNRKIVDYYCIFDLIERFSASQYALLMESIIAFLRHVKQRYHIGTTSFLEGKTWQELHTYDKAFSTDTIEKFFKKRGILAL